MSTRRLSTEISRTRIAPGRSDLDLSGDPEVFRAAFGAAGVPACLVGADGRIQAANAAMAAMLGHSVDELQDADLATIVAGPDNLRAALNRPGDGFELVSRSGETHRVALDVRLVPGAGNQSMSWLILVRAPGAQQSHHDGLTGLPDRAVLIDALELGLDPKRRSAGTRVAVLFIDVDGFKEMNDRFGRDGGDTLLVRLVERLQRAVPPGGMLARWGSDELMVFCDDIANPVAALGLGQTLLDACHEPTVIDGEPITVRASIGIATSVVGEGHPAAVLGDADAALYTAKLSGGARIHLSEGATRTGHPARNRLALDLRRGLKRGEFQVHYQPVVPLGGGKPFGVEALVRWAPEGCDPVGPSEFIQEAEDSGVIVPLGAWVLNEACRQVVAWDSAGPAPQTLSVNLSGRQLAEPGLLETVRSALAESRLPPSRLCLEITESMLIDPSGESMDNLRALRALGAHVAIDDFGTGYSSLGYLKHFPIDTLKLDRAFVIDAGDSEADALIATIVNLAHSMGVTVTAEGVETDEQVIAVRALGCDSGQGYYWSRPMPAADLPAWAGGERSVLATDRVDAIEVIAATIADLRAATGRPIVFEAPRRRYYMDLHPHMLRTTVGHLVINAVAHSPVTEPIVVTTGISHGTLRVTIADRGRGMTPNEAARCFEQFWRSDQTRAERGGAGMGLWLAREMLEAVGGRITCNTRPGDGTRMTFTLPR